MIFLILISNVLVRVSITLMNTVIKSKLEWKGFIWLILPYYSTSMKELRTGTQQGKNLKAEADAMAMED